MGAFFGCKGLASFSLFSYSGSNSGLNLLHSFSNSILVPGIFLLASPACRGLSSISVWRSILILFGLLLLLTAVLRFWPRRLLCWESSSSAKLLFLFPVLSSLLSSFSTVRRGSLHLLKTPLLPLLFFLLTLPHLSTWPVHFNLL